MVNASNNVMPDNHFDRLPNYLKGREEIDEKLGQLDHASVRDQLEKATNLEKRYAATKSARRLGSDINGDERHRGKILLCKQFKEVEASKKLEAAEKLGVCSRCLMCPTQGDECKDT